MPRKDYGSRWDVFRENSPARTPIVSCRLASRKRCVETASLDEDDGLSMAAVQ